MRVSASNLVLLTNLLLMSPITGGAQLPIGRDRPAAEVTAQSFSTEIPGPTKDRVLRAYGNLPLSFEANLGQTDGQVKFLSRGPRHALFLTPTAVVLALRTGDGRHSPLETGHSQRDGAFLRTRLLGANRTPQIAGAGELPGKVNYFVGNDPKHWYTGIPTFRQVTYRQVYPGIDLVYHGDPQRLEYDFIVAPSANPRAIRLGFEGADALRIDAHGNLILRVAGAEVRQYAPVAYQEIGRAKRGVASRYILQGRNRVGFQVADYDTTKPLVIDPVLGYSTFLGGNNRDEGMGIALDASGDAYVTGTTSSLNFPTMNPFQASCGGCPSESDAFVTKLDPTGSTVLFSTYLGGTDSDEGLGITVDAGGGVYVTGDTFSTDFPITPGAFQTSLSPGTCGSPPSTFPCPDAFVTKLNPSGSSLVYSTYLGGSQTEYGFGIVVDAAGSAYVTGSTNSANFPTTPGSFQSTFGGGMCSTGRGTSPCPDAFVTKLDPTGSTLAYSTYVGGSHRDEALGVFVDGSGNAYITGDTSSGNFPTTAGAYQTILGGGTCFGEPCPDVFVTKLDPTGSTAVYSTYLGGSDADGGAGIAVDASGNAYVTGNTSSANFPTTPGAFQTALGGGICGTPPDTSPCPDALVTKLNPAGSGLIYSTYLGGSNDDEGNAIAIDTSGNAYLTGVTSSTNFPLMSPLQPTFGGGPSDAFVTRLNADSSGLLYSTYLGGSQEDAGTGIAVDASGAAYVTGKSNSTDFPVTPGAFQITFGGGTCGTAPCADGFISKVSP